jgi:serine/threonine protein kinase
MTDSTPDPQLEPLGSRYLLEEAIGSGAMGQVWRGRTRDGDPVAIKLLRPELSADSGVVTRFLQEAQILKGLDDPHLVRVHDFVAENDRLGIVMDLVEGPDLRSELARRGTFRPIEAAELTDGVLAGLAAVHAGGVVHRDVKPENVLLSGGAPGGARLADFGVARIVEESQKSRRTTVIGTPEYLAPEVADGADPTAASDLYAVGVMLYELVAGVTPFTGGSPLAVLRRHAEAQPVRPEGMPDGIWRTVTALLAKDPAQRPATAQQVREGLRAEAATFAAAPATRPITEPPKPTVTAQPTVAGIRSETATLPRVEAPAGATVAAPVAKKRRGPLVALLVALLVLAIGGGVTAFAMTRDSNLATPVAPSSTPSEEDVSPSPAPETGTTEAEPTPDEGELPDLTGMQLREAERELRNAGLQSEVVEVFQEDVVDNSVIEQDPPAGSRVADGDVVTLTVARRPVTVQLDRLTPVEESDYGWDYTQANLDGDTYVRSLVMGTDQYCANPAIVQYDLGRNFQTFSTLVGPSDGSYSQTVIQFDVRLDGRSVFSGRSKLGEPLTVDVDVTGGLRMELSVARLDPTCGSVYEEASAVWADPELQGTQDAVDAIPASPTS